MPDMCVPCPWHTPPPPLPRQLPPAKALPTALSYLHHSIPSIVQASWVGILNDIFSYRIPKIPAVVFASFKTQFCPSGRVVCGYVGYFYPISGCCIVCFIVFVVVFERPDCSTILVRLRFISIMVFILELCATPRLCSAACGTRPICHSRKEHCTLPNIWRFKRGYAASLYPEQPLRSAWHIVRLLPQLPLPIIWCLGSTRKGCSGSLNGNGGNYHNFSFI